MISLGILRNITAAALDWLAERRPGAARRRERERLNDISVQLSALKSSVLSHNVGSLDIERQLTNQRERVAHSVREIERLEAKIAAEKSVIERRS